MDTEDKRAGFPSAADTEAPSFELTESVIDILVQALLPEIYKFYETEEGRRALAEWEAEQEGEQMQESKSAA